MQVIKKDKEEGGVLEFGTEVVSAADGYQSLLLCWEPRPALQRLCPSCWTLLKRCFRKKFSSPEWQQKLKQMIPSFGENLGQNAELLEKVRNHSGKVLLIELPVPQ